MIEVSGPNVFKGYWRMPEKTADEFTSDLLVQDRRRRHRRRRRLRHHRRPQQGPDHHRRLQRLPGRDRRPAQRAAGRRRIGRRSACRTRTSARRWSPSSCRGPAPRRTRQALIAALKSRIAAFKVPKRVFVVADAAAQRHGQGAEEPAARRAPGAVRPGLIDPGQASRSRSGHHSVMVSNDTTVWIRHEASACAPCHAGDTVPACAAPAEPAHCATPEFRGDAATLQRLLARPAHGQRAATGAGHRRGRPDPVAACRRRRSRTGADLRADLRPPSAGGRRRLPGAAARTARHRCLRAAPARLRRERFSRGRRRASRWPSRS